MNEIMLELGPITIYWYSFFIFIGILIGSFLVIKESKRHKISEKEITDIIFYAVIVGIIGARLYYVLFNLDYYLSSPISIIKIWEGGLAIHGGIIAAFLFLIFYSKKKGYKLFQIVDILVPSVILGQAIGRWGNFFNQEAHGPVVEKSVLAKYVPNFIVEGMKIDGLYYHPTFLYESLYNLIGFVILILLRRYKKLKMGMLTCIYMMWYSLGRYFIEGLRTDSLMLGDLKMAQIVSIGLFALGFVGMIYFMLSRKNYFYYRKEFIDGQSV